MYDITIVMPCSTAQEKYINRLDYFKKYGIVNIQNNKIKIILLADHNSDNDILYKGWGYDVEVLKYNYWHPAPKIYSFFGNLKEEHIRETKWMFKLDDDSITNLNDFLNLLNNKYNYLDSIYIMSEKYCRAIEEYYRNIIKQLKINHLIVNGNIREYECSVSSQQSLFDLRDSEKACYLFNKIVKEIGNKGYGDSIHNIAIRIAGIPIKFIDKISWLPKWSKFINKEYYHIHYIYNKKMVKSESKDEISEVVEFSNFELKIFFKAVEHKFL